MNKVNKKKVAGAKVVKNTPKPEVQDEEARRADLTAEAIDLGLDITGLEELADLEKAVADAKAEQDEDGEEDEDEETEDDEEEEGATIGAGAKKPAKVKKNIDTGSVDVVRGEGADAEYIRTYSEELNGEGYKELAEGFVSAEKNKEKGYRLVQSDTIPRVIVEYREYDKEKKDTVDKVREFTEREGADFKEAAIEFNMQVRGTIKVRGLKA